MKNLLLLLILGLLLLSCSFDRDVDCNCSHLNNVKKGQPVLLGDETFYFQYNLINSCRSLVGSIGEDKLIYMYVDCTLLKVKNN